jgi:hypothetical protein
MHKRSPAAGGTQRFESLAARAEKALEDARQTAADSEVLAAAMSLELDREGLLVRCAWCGRYSLAGEWMSAEELPKVEGVGRKLRDEQVTHSICPECMKHPS